MLMTTSSSRLNRTHFVDAAARFIDEHGEPAFTLRSLGEALGVDQSAVYRHFRDRAELVDAVQEWMFDRFADQRPAPEGTPRQQLVAGIAVIRQLLLQHPNLAVLTGRGIGLPSEVSAAVWTLELLGDMGLEGHQRLVAYQMIESFVYGTCIYDSSGGWEAMELRRRWYRQLGLADTDVVSRSTDAVVTLTAEAFDAGLNALLDACERLAT
jgi:AcrR family transcriptional regulator